MEDFTEALGVDVGSKRIGVARINTIAQIPQPIKTIKMSEIADKQVIDLVHEYKADIVIVGLPITLNREDSDQTMYSREFAGKLEALGAKVDFQDETLSSNEARELIENGAYTLNDERKPVSVDEVAACVILKDYISQRQEGH